MLEMHVAKVARCQCGGHAWILLQDRANERSAEVQIDAPSGRALVAEMAGLPSPIAEAMDLLPATLAAVKTEPDRLELRTDGEAVDGLLYLRGRDGEVSAVVDICHALLAAVRLKLPILMSEQDAGPTSSPTTVPPVYHAVLDTLGLDGLGTPPGQPESDER
jgi:hypothetical protein